MKLITYRRGRSDEVDDEPMDVRVERPGDLIAAITETPDEMKIDIANGLRGAKGRRPVPADFDGLLSPEGDSGELVGTEVAEDA
jgi:hypothetical protein